MNDRSDVSSRAKRPNSFYRYCRILGCPNPARAGTEQGLDQRYCRKHADFHSRHGSYVKRSYTARQLAPFRRTVRAWIKANSDDPWFKNALVRVAGLYERAGRFEEAFRLRGMSAQERARKAWARLRHASVAPEKVVDAWLVIELAIRFDEAPDLKREFKRVQAAKLVHRLASGSHKSWKASGGVWSGSKSTSPVETEIHVYPHSRGRVLRHIGADMEAACELVVLERIESITRLHNERRTRRP